METAELTLRELVKRSGKTQAQIAEHLGVDRTYVSQMVTGKVNWVNSVYFPALVQELGLTLREVEQLRPDAVTALASAAINAGASIAREHTAALHGSIRSSERQLVAVHALAAAGAGVWTESAALEYIAVESWVAKRRHRVTFCVDGDSMAPTLNGGDYIHVDINQLDVQEDKLYVVQIIGDGIVVKRARMFRGEMVLVSDNPLYPPLRPDEAKIIGRVFAVTPQTVRL